MGFCSENKERIGELIGLAKNGTEDIFGAIGAKKDELMKSAKDLKDVKANDLLAAVKLNELMKKEEPEKKKSPIVTILAVIGAIVAVAGIAFAVYKYFAPDYLEDFDDDMDFDDDDDLFEDEDLEDSSKE